MKKIISFALIVISVLLCLVGCDMVLDKDRSFDGTYTPDSAKYGTDEQIYITIDSIEMIDGKPVINATWHNESSRLICFGLGYKVERFENESWTDVMVEDFAIMEIACMVDPGRSAQQTYRLEYFDLTEEGNYRLLVEYSYSDEQGGSGSTYVIFNKTNK